MARLSLEQTETARGILLRLEKLEDDVDRYTGPARQFGPYISDIISDVTNFIIKNGYKKGYKKG